LEDVSDEIPDNTTPDSTPNEGQRPETTEQGAIPPERRTPPLDSIDDSTDDEQETPPFGSGDEISTPNETINTGRDGS
jgi:hypothetical protein